MVEGRHELVPRLAADVHVTDRRVVRQSVERQVALQEPLVLLGLDARHDAIHVAQEGRVDPRRQRDQRCRQGARAEDQQAHDALHPGGTRLHRGRDDDVARPQRDMIPPLAVEVMAAVGAGTTRRVHALLPTWTPATRAIRGTAVNWDSNETEPPALSDVRRSTRAMVGTGGWDLDYAAVSVRPRAVLRSTSLPFLKTAPLRTRATRCGAS